MIDLRGIEKSYGNLRVLRGINLQVFDREIVAIVGPSGAGKTTLLQIMGLLDIPDAGSVQYNGEEVTSKGDKALSAFRNAHIGFVFQFHQLLPEFTALENVMIPGLIGGLPHKKAATQAASLLQRLGLSERINHKPAEMSGGERQRVAVARALMNNPDVILADEPTGSLDTKNKDEISRLFCTLKEEFGQTIVIVTHDPSIAEIADKTIYMKDGIIERIIEKNDSTLS